MRERFDVTSKPSSVANALRECEARQATLKAQLHEEKEYARDLSAILGQRIGGNLPGRGVEGILRKIEGSVKRSVSHILAAEMKEGRTLAEAKAAALVRADFVCEKYHLGAVTASMLKYIEETAAKLYGVKKPPFSVNSSHSFLQNET